MCTYGPCVCNKDLLLCFIFVVAIQCTQVVLELVRVFLSVKTYWLSVAYAYVHVLNKSIHNYDFFFMLFFFLLLSVFTFFFYHIKRFIVCFSSK